MTVHRYNSAVQTDRSHSVVRSVMRGVSVSITFDDAHTATETVIWNSLTWTAVASGATGRQYNIGGSATLTAANFASAVTAHADGTDYEVTSSGAVVTITRRDPTATIGLVTGTAAHSGDVYVSPQIPDTGNQVAVVFDDAIATTKDELWQGLRAAIRALRRDSAKGTAPADFSTSETTVE